MYHAAHPILCNVLYCIVVLCGVVLCCIALYYIVLYSVVLQELCFKTILQTFHNMLCIVIYLYESAAHSHFSSALHTTLSLI